MKLSLLFGALCVGVVVAGVILLSGTRMPEPTGGARSVELYPSGHVRVERTSTLETLGIADNVVEYFETEMRNGCEIVRVKAQGAEVHGVRSGLWREWDLEGSRTITLYSNGEPYLRRCYAPEGLLLSVETIANGKRNGPCSYFAPVGGLLDDTRSGYFVDDKRCLYRNPIVRDPFERYAPADGR